MRILDRALGIEVVCRALAHIAHVAATLKAGPVQLALRNDASREERIAQIARLQDVTPSGMIHLPSDLHGCGQHATTLARAAESRGLTELIG